MQLLRRFKSKTIIKACGLVEELSLSAQNILAPPSSLCFTERVILQHIFCQYFLKMWVSTCFDCFDCVPPFSAFEVICIFEVMHPDQDAHFLSLHELILLIAYTDRLKTCMCSGV